jgi:hypothetical protein
MNHVFNTSIGLLVVVGTTFAQVPAARQPIDVEGPGQAITPRSLRAGSIQIEMGIDNAQLRAEAGTFASTLNLPRTTIRYGLVRGLELRAGWDLQVENMKSYRRESITSGFGPLRLGAKVVIAAPSEDAPEAAFIGELRLPVGSDHFTPFYMAPSFRLSMRGWASRSISFTGTIGGEWSGNTAEADGIYAGQGTWRFYARRLMMFIEVNGRMASHRNPYHVAITGLRWVPLEMLEVNIHGGVGLNKHSPSSVIGLGAAVQF